MKKIRISQIRLTRSEQAIERAAARGEFRVVTSGEEFDKIAEAIARKRKEIAEAVARRKKDAVLNIRVNSQDLESIKRKAKKLGIPYQTFVSELIHQYAV